MKDILFVCTGNLCRSPMAEAYLVHCLGERLRTASFTVWSRGTHANPGALAPAEACEVCREVGVNLSSHRADVVSYDDIERADLVLVMEKFHRNQLMILAPKAKHKIRLLSESLSGRARGREIPDPYGQSLKTYRDCLRLMKDAIDAWVAKDFDIPL